MFAKNQNRKNKGILIFFLSKKKTGKEMISVSGRKNQSQCRTLEYEEIAAKNINLPTTVTIQKDDFVLSLATKIYNRTITWPMLMKIKEANPHIKDLDQIEIGDKILFPDISIYN